MNLQRLTKGSGGLKTQKVNWERFINLYLDYLMMVFLIGTITNIVLISDLEIRLTALIFSSIFTSGGLKMENHRLTMNLRKATTNSFLT